MRHPVLPREAMQAPWETAHPAGLPELLKNLSVPAGQGQAAVQALMKVLEVWPPVLAKSFQCCAHRCCADQCCADQHAPSEAASPGL